MSIKSGISTRIEDFIITKAIAILNTDNESLSAYKMGLIDKDGRKIKSPKSTQEKKALSKMTEFVLELKYMLQMRKPLRDQTKIDLKRKYALRGAYDMTQQDLELTEQTFTYVEILQALTEDTQSKIDTITSGDKKNRTKIYKKLKDTPSKTLSDKERDELLTRRNAHRKSVISKRKPSASATATGDCLATPTTEKQPIVEASQNEIETLINLMLIKTLQKMTPDEDQPKEPEELRSKLDSDRPEEAPSFKDFGKRQDIILDDDEDLIFTLKRIGRDTEREEIANLMFALQSDDLTSTERETFKRAIKNEIAAYDRYSSIGYKNLTSKSIENLCNLDVDDFSRKKRLSNRTSWGMVDEDPKEIEIDPDADLNDQDKERVQLLLSLKGKTEESQEKIDKMIETLRDDTASKEDLITVYKICNLIDYHNQTSNENGDSYAISMLKTIHDLEIDFDYDPDAETDTESDPESDPESAQGDEVIKAVQHDDLTATSSQDATQGDNTQGSAGNDSD